jgi:DNA-binding transcriptional regulator YiaG
MDIQMKRKRIQQFILDRDGRLRSNGRIVHARVDKSRLNSAAAFAPDEDAPVLTAREIASFRRVKPPKAIDPRVVRKRLRMSQTAFAHVFGVSVRTVQEWEQHRRKPAGAARALLQVIDREPEAVRRAIGL